MVIFSIDLLKSSRLLDMLHFYDFDLNTFLLWQFRLRFIYERISLLTDLLKEIAFQPFVLINC